MKIKALIAIDAAIAMFISLDAFKAAATMKEARDALHEIVDAVGDVDGRLMGEDVVCIPRDKWNRVLTAYAVVCMGVE